MYMMCSAQIRAIGISVSSDITFCIWKMQSSLLAALKYSISVVNHSYPTLLQSYKLHLLSICTSRPTHSPASLHLSLPPLSLSQALLPLFYALLLGVRLLGFHVRICVICLPVPNLFYLTISSFHPCCCK